jgi:iron complex transport system substrate-binding protein
VSLSPTATETLYAIGAGKEVQAVDIDSDYPTTGLPTKRINSLNPSVEAVIGICKATPSNKSPKPDLVIISYDANEIQQKLTAVGVKVVNQEPPSVAGALAQIEQLGTLTGHVESADALAASIKSTIDADIASVPKHPRQDAHRVLRTLDQALLLAHEFDLRRCAVEVPRGDEHRRRPEHVGRRRLSRVERRVHREFESEVHLPRGHPQWWKADAATVAERPGWSKVAAVQDHDVIGLNDDIASRWGPRLSLLMNQLTASVKGCAEQSQTLEVGA